MEAQAADETDEPATGVHAIGKRYCRHCHVSRPAANFERSPATGLLRRTCTKCLDGNRRKRAASAKGQKHLAWDAPLPQTCGERVLVHGRLIRHINTVGKTVLMCLARCVCGRESHVRAANWRRGTAGPVCQSCIGTMNATRRNELMRAHGVDIPTPRNTRKPRTEHQIRLDTLPWERDFETQMFVEDHVDGAKLEDVGQYMGLTRERVRQIEAKALRKLKAKCKEEGLTLQDFLGTWRGPALRHKRGMQPLGWGEVQQRGAA